MIPVFDAPCALCGRSPASGFAAIGGARLCHGEDDPVAELEATHDPTPTCYETALQMISSSFSRSLANLWDEP